MNRRDYLKWTAVLFALVATASAEYDLARAVGYSPLVAAAVPGALDVYTVRAMRQHRDVFASVVAMVAVNAASHLVSAGLLPVNIPLVVGVSAIAPLVLYRVHRISRTTDTTPAAEPQMTISQVLNDTGWPHPHTAPPRPADKLTGKDIDKAFGEIMDEVWAGQPPAAPKPVAAPTRSKALAKTQTKPRAVSAKVAAPAPAADDELLAAARRDFTDGTPGVKALKERYGIGQARAQRIRDQLNDDTTIRVARDYQEAHGE